MKFNGPSSSKRARRRFTIDELIDGGGGGNDSKRTRRGFTINELMIGEPKHYVRQISSNKEHNEKFKTLIVKSAFTIENIPADPEELLRQLFDHCIKEAIQDAAHKGIEPDRLGALISSPLLQPDIWIGIREIREDTVENILNRFMIVAQSKAREGSLWGEPFTVTITAVNRKALPTQKEVRGSGAPKRLRHVHHKVNESSLLKVNNPFNTYCLFYALELTRIHNTKQMNSKRFSHYLTNGAERQKRDVLQLMQNADIPLSREDYDAAVYVPQIVRYWNRRYAANGQRFKVFIFGSLGHYKPKDEYGPDNFTHPISLFHHNAHFDGIRYNVGAAIFGRAYYCFSCLVPYDKAIDHRRNCKLFCSQCGRIGKSGVGLTCKLRQQPKDPDFRHFCAGCGKLFEGDRECYEHHIQSNYCWKSKKCNECGCIWSVKRNNYNGRDGHKCNTHYCRLCYRWHSKEDGNCFISPIDPSRRDQKPYRLIFYDFETMQDEQINRRGERGFIHIVNFAAAIVTCSNCIASGKWHRSVDRRQQQQQQCNDGGEPNVVSSSMASSHCLICGPHRTVAFSHCAFYQTEVDLQLVCDDPLEEFVGWILSSGQRQYKTYAYAHNSGRFDAIFIFKSLFMRGIMPALIRRGNKILELRVKRTAQNGMISFRDSFNFLACGLDRLAGAFGVNNGGKEFFPYLYNRRCNYGRVVRLGDIPKNDFLFRGMRPDRKRRFECWYEQNRWVEFDLREALAAYCLSDVQILAQILIAFRQEFIDITSKEYVFTVNENGENGEQDWIREYGLYGEEERNEQMCLGDGDEEAATAGTAESHTGICPFSEAITISSACMRYFRMRYLKPEHLPLINSRPLDKADSQSTIALKYIAWRAHKDGCYFQTAHSPEREKRFGRYSVDAWCPQTGHILEFYGCAFHACPVHYPNPSTIMPNGRTAGRIRQDDAEREQFLRKHCEIFEYQWECTVRQLLKMEPEMRRFFNEYIDRGPIQIRQAFFGGRTQVFRLHFECPPGWKITYGDVNSLYPAMMLHGLFPVGAPRVHVIGEPDCNVNWTCGEQIPIRGILKVFVIPPERIDIPVLPMKFDDRLVFSLCRECTLQYPQGARIDGYRCKHNERQRGWLAVLPHCELAVALDAGYRVTAYYRGIEFEQFDSELFKPYIQDFMAMKIHASGFPAGMTNEEEQMRFIAQCRELHGIIVDQGKMCPNDARKEAVKVVLNNLWGKFGMNSNLTKTLVTDSPAELRAQLDNRKIEIGVLDILNEDCVLISSDAIEEFDEPHSYHNPVISLWCTSLARLHLLELLRAVVRNSQLVLLYCDTDGMYVAHPENVQPFPMGPHIGQIKDEMPGKKIVEFVAAGCKNYAIRYIDLSNGEEKTIEHVRGISLSAEVCELLHFQSLKQSVLYYGNNFSSDNEEEANNVATNMATEIDEDPGEILIEYSHYLEPVIRDGAVYTVPYKKFYRPIITKGVVDRGMVVREFGYRGSEFDNVE